MESDEWAKDLWKKATQNWKNREQDSNYRKFLTHPALEEELRDFSVDKGVLVDLGCGEGTETAYLRDILTSKGVERFCGFDINSDLISHARRTFKEISFSNGDIIEFMRKYKLKERADIVTSLFVLQDTPRIRELVEASYDILSSNGMFLTLIVNPEFAKLLLAKGVLREIGIVDHIRRKEYDFAASYPIVEVGKKPFYVPYFHRSLGHYIDLLGEYFSVESVRGLKPSKSLIDESLENKTLPFYSAKNNVYWPEISQVPSSVLIRGIKL